VPLTLGRADPVGGARNRKGGKSGGLGRQWGLEEPFSRGEALSEGKTEKINRKSGAFVLSSLVGKGRNAVPQSGGPEEGKKTLAVVVW